MIPDIILIRAKLCLILVPNSSFLKTNNTNRNHGCHQCIQPLNTNDWFKALPWIIIIPPFSLVLFNLLLQTINATAAFTKPFNSPNCYIHHQTILPPHSTTITMASLPPAITTSITKIDDLITTDAGGRGMKYLVVSYQDISMPLLKYWRVVL